MSSDYIENLVEQSKNGDVEAFGKLYELFARDMYRFAYYYTSSKLLAEDAVSDAVLSAFENIKKLKKAESFKPWLFKILFNCCRQKQKEKAVSYNFTELSELRNETAEQTDICVSIGLKRALETISQQEKEIVILAFACGYTSYEIAEMLGTKPGTVRSKLSRAAAKLRTQLQTQNGVAE